VRGEKEPDERVVLSEVRGTRGLISGKWRAIFREGPSQTRCFHAHTGDDEKCITVAEELFDLETDPGERKNVAASHPEVMEEMRARLAAAKKNFIVAGTHQSLTGSGASIRPVQNVQTATIPPPDSGPPKLRFRFAGAGAAHRVSGRIAFAPGTTLAWEPVGLPRQAVVANGPTLEIALTTAPDAAVGLDIIPTPPTADVSWQLFL